MTPKQIAEVCHEANRAITKHTKDVPLQPSWDSAPDEMKESAVHGVEWRLKNLDAPAAKQHEEWMRHKLAEGWKLGPTKDPVAKTHPALIPYDQLSADVRSKDAVFTNIIRALAS